MRHLLVLRHAEAASASGLHDHERPLTAAGRETAARVGAFLARSGLDLDLALVSDASRTRETWEQVAAAFAEAPQARVLARLYHAESRDLLELARDLPDSAACALILGHNPAVGEFTAHFTGSGDREAVVRLRRGFPPGGLAILQTDADSWRALRWGDGALTHFLT